MSDSFDTQNAAFDIRPGPPFNMSDWRGDRLRDKRH